MTETIPVSRVPKKLQNEGITEEKWESS